MQRNRPILVLTNPTDLSTVRRDAVRGLERIALGPANLRALQEALYGRKSPGESITWLANYFDLHVTVPLDTAAALGSPEPRDPEPGEAMEHLRLAVGYAQQAELADAHSEAETWAAMMATMHGGLALAIARLAPRTAEVRTLGEQVTGYQGRNR